MINWLKSLFKRGRPAGPPETLRSFSSTDNIITKDGVTESEGGWRIDAADSVIVRLFEVPAPTVDSCLLTYQAQLRTERLNGKAYLEMWCRFAGRGEFFSKDLQNVVSGTNDWASYETPFYLKAGQQPDLIKMNLVVDGTGIIWIRNVKLMKTPLR